MQGNEREVFLKKLVESVIYDRLAEYIMEKLFSFYSEEEEELKEKLLTFKENKNLLKLADCGIDSTLLDAKFEKSQGSIREAGTNTLRTDPLRMLYRQ